MLEIKHADKLWETNKERAKKESYQARHRLMRNGVGGWDRVKQAVRYLTCRESRPYGRLAESGAEGAGELSGKIPPAPLPIPGAPLANDPPPRGCAALCELLVALVLDQAAMRQAVMQAPPVQAVRMAPAPGSMMNVTVPPGACGGHSLQVNAPVGPLCVQVPPALREGDTFTIELPAQTAVAMPGACASASGAVAMGRPV